MTEYIITDKQIEELNKAHGGMEIVTSWLSAYAIWDTSNTYPVMKSEHVAVDLPEIVRCGDCRAMRVKYGNTGIECWKNGEPFTVEPDGFCKWGERKGDAE